MSTFFVKHFLLPASKLLNIVPKRMQKKILKNFDILRSAFAFEKTAFFAKFGFFGKKSVKIHILKICLIEVR